MTKPIETIPSLDGNYNITVQEYIEIISDLIAENRVARVKDIAKHRGVTRSSVSTALNMLSDLGLVEHEHYGYVMLTQKGQNLGDALAKRHKIILRFLRDCLQLEPELADSEACRLEHTMSREALNALVRFVADAENCPVCSRLRDAVD